MDATSLEDLVIAVEDSLRQDFQVPFVSLILFGDNPMPVGRWVKGAKRRPPLAACCPKARPSAAACASMSWTSCLAKTSASRSARLPWSPSTIKACMASWPLPAVTRSTTRSTVGTLFLTYIAEVLGRSVAALYHALRSVR
jgi:uncharacterized protein